MTDRAESVEEFLARGGKIEQLSHSDKGLEDGDFIYMIYCPDAKHQVHTRDMREKGRKGAAEYKRRMEAKKR